MALEYHLIGCDNPFGDIYYHGAILLFDTEKRIYKEDTGYVLSEEYMRENNSIERILTIEELGFETELEAVLKYDYEYDHNYYTPSMSYFHPHRNSCSLNRDDDLPF